MREFTTCATCGDTLAVTAAMPAGYMTHPDCPPATDTLNVLRRNYITAIQAGVSEDELRRKEHEIDAFGDQPAQLEAAALRYATWGWPVLPCRPGLKTPASEHGLKDATTDPAQIREWWWRWPAANVAIATGHTFDVIDIDPAGFTWWHSMLRRRELGQDAVLPDIHGQVSTPRTLGIHLYVEPSGKGNLAGFAEGVDYRGVGGYVLVPPSVLSPTAYAKGTSTQGQDLFPGGRLNYTWTVYPSPAIKQKAAV